MTLATIGCVSMSSSPTSATRNEKVFLPNIKGKQIYIPEELRTNNWEDTTAQWSRYRMKLLPDFAIFWQKGFGNDLKNPPALQGHDMHVDMDNLTSKLERFYAFFKDTLQFIKPGSNADKYRMMVMLRYSLEGTAYGGDYDKKIGAFWVAPNRIHDTALNCVAHELGHSFQLQIACDRKESDISKGKEFTEWQGGSFYEMTSQWMLWHVNPYWLRDETYHWQSFRKLAHKAFLHWENAYHSPYVLEYWSEKRGLPFIATIFREGQDHEDPIEVYKRLTGLTQETFNNEIFEANRHIIDLDFSYARKETRPYRLGFTTTFTKENDGWLKIDPKNCPENYGFNAIPLSIPAQGKKTVVTFEGLAGAKGYNNENTDAAGWRYGFVAVTKDDRCLYTQASDKPKGKITFKTPAKEQLTALYLIVMGAPTRHWHNPDPEKGKDAQWPYRIKLKGTTLNTANQ